MKVYIVRDDKDYPQEIVKVFFLEKDAEQFVLESSNLIVQEWDVIQ